MAKSAETSDFWRRLMQARRTASKPLGLRQEDVAKSVGAYQSAVTKWKTGKGLPTTANVRTLALEASVSFDWLLTGRGEMRSSSNDDPQLDRLLWHWNTLTPAGRRRVLHFAKLEHASQFTGDPKARLEHERQMAEFTREHMAANGIEPADDMDD